MSRKSQLQNIAYQWHQEGIQTKSQYILYKPKKSKVKLGRIYKQHNNKKTNRSKHAKK